MDTTRPPGIQINSVVLEDISFAKFPALDLSVPYNVNINVHNESGVDEKNPSLGRCLQTIKIVESTGSLFSLQLTYGLYASVITGQENMPIMEYLSNSAPSALYQIARETVLTLSQKAGMPLILPPMNLSKPKEK